MKESVLLLGELLIKEFKLDPGVDTLSKWMIYYIAQQMTIAKNSKGTKKASAEKNCFETILKLWKHKSYFPKDHRPFDNYDVIFKTIERISPENTTPYYYLLEENKEVQPEVQKWLDIALEVDRTTRIWLDFIFKEAIGAATDTKVKEWLEICKRLDNNDKNIIEFIDSFGDRKTNQEEISKIKSRINSMKAFGRFNRDLIKVFEKELKEVKDKD